ncbi:MAG: sulfatase-like hydrolase/transferase [Pseudomonadota bacterium]|nr:sulfatase-like hydrolase/transferase [Pseudomonadota bacterium]
MASKNKPNFLLVMTDQHRADHLGCYGNRIISTPNIDSIAANGLSYDKFYVSCPICMPNRATMMTGRTPSINGVLTNGLSLPWHSNTFVNVLKYSGYQTALLGKSHLQNMINYKVEDWNYPPRRAGVLPQTEFDDAYLNARSGSRYENERLDLFASDPDRKVAIPYYGFDKVQFANGHGDAVGGHYTGWVNKQYNNFRDLLGPENQLPGNDYIAPQTWRTAVPEELHSTSFVETSTIQYLEDYISSKTDKPFFVQTSFPDPHHPFVPPGRYWGMYEPGDCPIPGSLGVELNDPPPFQKELHKQLANGTRESRVAAYACNEREVRESTALTYGMISFVDDAIGRILVKLKELGLDKNTVVIFTSDHGDLMGEHGLMLKHCFHNEGLIKVPFIWSDPYNPSNGARTDILGGTIDIASTVIGRAGLSPYHGMQGFDVVGAFNNGTSLPRLGMYLEEDEIPFNANCEHYLRTRTFVTERWRLTYWLEHEFGELYDRYNDPFELNNLWTDTNTAGEKALLLEMMMRERFVLDEMAPKAEFCA